MNKDFMNVLVSYKRYLLFYVCLSIIGTCLAQQKEILFVAYSFPWYTQLGFAHQMKASSKNGFNVSVYTLADTDLKNDVIDELYDSVQKIFRVHIPDNLSSYSIICCQSALLAKKFIRLKQKLGFQAPIISYIQRADMPHLNRDFFRSGDLFICDSQYIKYQLELRGCRSSKIVVLPTPIDLQMFPFRMHLFDPNKTLNILSVGSLNECLAYCDVIQTLKERIIEKDPKLSLRYTIIGVGKEKQAILQAINKYKMEKYVTLIESCSVEKLISQLKEAHIFIHPACTTRDGLQEGVPDCLKEAMAIGTIVITTRHGGLQEIVEDNKTGFLIPEHDILYLGSCITSLLRHPERWPMIQLNARKFIEEHYNMQQFETQFAGLLHSLC